MLPCPGILQFMALDLVLVKYRVLLMRYRKKMVRQIPPHHIATLKISRQVGKLSQGQRIRRG